MNKIKDERLAMRNLQNIRILFIILIIGIVCILGYDFYKGGMDAVTDDPLWFLFILTGVVNAYLNMSLSVENEKESKNPRKSLIISLSIWIIIAALVAIASSMLADTGIGVLSGVIILASGLIPSIYIYRLRVKLEEDADDK